MGIFPSLFKKRTNLEPDIDVAQEKKILPEIREEDFVDNSDPKDQIVTIQYGTNMPIDAIYAFISRDYEPRGYNDAMCNADSSYKNTAITMIKSDLKRLFRQVELRYKNDLRNVIVHVDILEQQGLIDSTLPLKAKKETIMEHLKEMEEMVKALDNSEEQMLSMVNSYERGFYKGLVAKSNSVLQNGIN